MRLPKGTDEIGGHALHLVDAGNGSLAGAGLGYTTGGAVVATLLVHGQNSFPQFQQHQTSTFREPQRGHWAGVERRRR